MFDVLMYLFDTYIAHSNELYINESELTEELTMLGFHRDDVKNALGWLEKLVIHPKAGTYTTFTTGANPTMRCYSEEEMQRLDIQCRGFLLSLEQAGILDENAREQVIARVLDLQTPQFELNDLQWVVLMVLMNLPGYESACQHMEILLNTPHDAIWQ